LPVLFISDLHLSAQTPAITRRFFAFLEGEARAAGELTILGDLFEAWPGDDAIDDAEDPTNAEVVAALRAFTDGGGRLAILPGNRDFLLGDEFARRSGGQLLADPSVIDCGDCGDCRLIIAHGDALCTADADYQQFRRQVRDPAWQTAFLARPLAERRAIADALRRQSDSVKRDKSPQLMDVSDAAVEDFLRAHGGGHANVTLIHGHTHRPATHAHALDGRSSERWVTADWSDTAGEYLRWDGERISRHPLP
jgi:UDP-2,3-diacylglucosamine hydrolase